MKGFIFAAGYGERLRPLTEDVPKSLLPVLNLPSICYAVLILKRAGIDHVICNLHYHYNDIIDFFKAHDNFGIKIEFSVEEKILGTGGGLKKCEQIIGDSEVLLINSDVIMDLDPAFLIKYHYENNSPATLVLRKTDMASVIGPVSIDENRIIDFKDFLGTNKKSEYIYTGAGIVSPSIFKYLNSEFSSIVYTGYIELIKKFSITFFEQSGYWYDIGSVDSYLESNIDLLKDFNDLSREMSQILGLNPEAISKDADIDKDTFITDSVIGQGASIKKGSIIERSVVLPGSVVNDGAEIINSVVYKDKVIRGER